MTLERLEFIKPVAECACGKKVYEHSAPCPLANCPLRGDAWLRRQQLHDMQNAWIGIGKRKDTIDE